jgi:diguanylate cyclase (GGDEF)-like protein/PAS domain S-box-containing protein
MSIIAADNRSIIDVNEPFCAALGYARDELVGQTPADFDFAGGEGSEELLEDLESRGHADSFAFTLRKKDGSLLSGKCTTVTVSIEGRACLFSTLLDVSGIKAAEKAQRDSELLSQTIVELAPEAVVVTSLDGAIKTFNVQAENIFGVADPERMNGASILEFVAPEDMHVAEGQLLKIMFTAASYYGEYRLLRLDGSTFWADVNAKMIPDAEGTPNLILLLIRDIAARKQEEERLQSIAVSDDLTGLYNRRGFNLAARQEIKHATRNGQGLGLLFLDIDGLKDINDRFGHSQGDAALMTAASILRKSFRESDIIARWGGDEFVVLALDVPEGCIDRLLDRFSDNVALYNSKEGIMFEISVSVGISFFDPGAPLDFEELVRIADAKMYRAKRKKKGETEIL